MFRGDAPSREPVGATAFGSLRAEDEPWLADCFVPPEDFDLLGGMQSVVVFGSPGSGKSAVREMLVRQCCASAGEPRCLVASWRPMPPVFEAVDGFQSVPGQVAHVFDACGMAILEYLVGRAEVWEQASGWVRSALAWFVHRFTQGSLEARVGPLLERDGRSQNSALLAVLQTEWEEDLLPRDEWSLVAGQVSMALQAIGLDGLWIVVDGLEPWVETQPQRVGDALRALLSTLPLFEPAAFAYKVFVPLRLQPALASSTGLVRRRLYSQVLTWREAQITRMVEGRLGLALGIEGIQLHDLCAADGFLEWLRRCGGTNPRAWLEALRPLVVHYLAQGLEHPIGEQAWRELRRRAPPRLSVDEENRRVLVGGREVQASEMTLGAFRLLCFLYRSPGQLVPWERLYYLGYQELGHVPSRDDREYENRQSWLPTLHTRMSDLRRAIEPDPEEPLYLETVRDKGVIMRVAL